MIRVVLQAAKIRERGSARRIAATEESISEKSAMTAMLWIPTPAHRPASSPHAEMECVKFQTVRVIRRNVMMAIHKMAMGAVQRAASRDLVPAAMESMILAKGVMMGIWMRPIRVRRNVGRRHAAMGPYKRQTAWIK